MEKVKRILPYMALALLVMQLLLMLGSWFYSAAFPMSGVRSLLSGEGMRWLLGHFSDIMATPVLVGLLLLSMATDVWTRVACCVSTVPIAKVVQG